MNDSNRMQSHTVALFYAVMGAKSTNLGGDSKNAKKLENFLKKGLTFLRKCAIIMKLATESVATVPNALV